MKPETNRPHLSEAHRSSWLIPARLVMLASLVLPFAACNGSHHTTPPATVPAAPEILAVTVDDGTAEVEWTLVPDATSYNCYWAHGESLDLRTCDRLRDHDRLHLRITGLQNGNSYCFAVSANINDIEGPLSQLQVRALAPGIALEISAAPGDSQVTVDWSTVPGATSYALYRGQVPGVTKTTGERFTPVFPPYVDAGLVNGTTYYYVVTAIGAGGEGRESLEVMAMPQAPAPGAPLTPLATLMEEVTNSVIISWQPPAGTTPDSYNLYWDTTPGVTPRSNVIPNVTSPYVHSGLAGQTTYYYVVTAFNGASESAPSMEVSATPRGSPGGGHTSSFGNNLALPLILADGYGLLGAPLTGAASPWLDYATALRPTVSDVVDPFPNFAPSTLRRLNGIDYFPQKSSSTWQAQWRYEPGPPLAVVADWGDNLQSASLTISKNIRIETVLYQDTTVSEPTSTMTAYTMQLLGGSGVTELYGTDGTTYPSNRWHVFTVTARLRIEKLTGPGGAVDPTVQGFDAAIHEGFGGEGSGGFSSEVNVSGKLVYGYVWMLKQWPLTTAQKTGWWRITFSLDPQAQFGSPAVTVQNRVMLTALDPGETVATLDVGNNRTSIEVNLQ